MHVKWQSNTKDKITLDIESYGVVLEHDRSDLVLRDWLKDMVHSHGICVSAEL